MTLLFVGCSFSEASNTNAITVGKNQLNGYRVSFVTNGGSYVNTMQTKAINSEPYTKKEGYIFDGWYYNEGLTQKVVYPMQVNSNMTLYAKWEAIYTVRFDANGGSYVDAKQTQRVNQAPYTERDGYVFDGWYYNEGLTNEVIYPIEVKSDMTLYAKWLLLEKESSCKDTRIKFLDSDYSEDAYYSLAPNGFDFHELEKRGYYISIEVQYDVKYKKDYDVPLDIGYFGSPKYKVGIINDDEIGVWKTDLGTSKSATTRSISKTMTVADFNKKNMYLYFATENVQNIVCLENITITYTCHK